MTFDGQNRTYKDSGDPDHVLTHKKLLVSDREIPRAMAKRITGWRSR